MKQMPYQKSPRDEQQLHETMRSRGWEIVRAGKHYKATKPGCGMVILSVSSSDIRAVLNAWSHVKRAERQGASV